MRGWLVVIVVLVISGVANAQPGATQPYPPPPPAYTAYPPRPVMQVQLTLDEQYLLERGYISDGQQIGGTVAAIFVGFGIGHAIQGRFGERGYMFAIGDAVTGGIFMYGMVRMYACIFKCSDAETDTAMRWLVVGMIASTTVRIWEVVDAAVGPSTHNRKVRELHMRLGIREPLYTRLTPYLSTPRDHSGAVAGLSLRF